jgi:hypothetical protein
MNRTYMTPRSTHQSMSRFKVAPALPELEEFRDLPQLTWYQNPFMQTRHGSTVANPMESYGASGLRRRTKTLQRPPSSQSLTPSTSYSKCDRSKLRRIRILPCDPPITDRDPNQKPKNRVNPVRSESLDQRRHGLHPPSRHSPPRPKPI